MPCSTAVQKSHLYKITFPWSFDEKDVAQQLQLQGPAVLKVAELVG